MAARMTDRTNHRRVLHFAVTGMLLGGAASCTSNEPAKAPRGSDVKTNPRPVPEPVPEPEPDPIREFAPNPGPNELEGKQPEVAPTTAVVEPKPEPLPPPEEDHVNEGPVKEPEPLPKLEPKPDTSPKRVNTGPVKAPEPKPEPAPIKVNPGPEG
jgi:hypothetical protein